MTLFSLIVLSRTNSDSIFKMNQECFDSFIQSAKKAKVDFEIILVESNKVASYDYQLDKLQIIKPDVEFNFHKFLNIGAANAVGDYYILSNNDVIYDSNCLEEVVKVQSNYKDILSFSPYDPKANKLPLESIENNSYILGCQIQKHLTGWCIIMHKSVIKTIKKLDERFLFYYADNDYAMQLQKYNIQHALVTKAKAFHLESGSSTKSKNSKSNPSKPLNKKLPSYILKENWTWVLGNQKMEEGLIQFHEKWGSRRSLKLKLKVTNRLSKMGMGFLNKFILTHS